MSAPIDGLPRRVIPRWRDFRTAAAMGELGAAGTGIEPPPVPTGLSALEELWKEQKTEVVAGELLSAAWLEGQTDLAADAATFLLRRGSSAHPLTKEFAQNLLEDLTAASSEIEPVQPLNQNAVRSIRAALRLYPHDALGWCELGRYYAINGKQEKARRAILTAVQLSPESRYILRSAARGLIHLGDADAALELLSKSPRTFVDPWLMAAHVAIGNIVGKAPRFYKRAKELRSSESLPPFHTAELDAALATIELSSGKDKAAREFLSAALRDPTENALAQAWWARPKLNISIDPRLLEVPRSFEANTRALVFTEHWQGAGTAAERWLEDEPFSSSPAIELSFILSVAFEEHERATQFLQQALRANPDDLLVVNNLAFALGSLGKTQDARAILGAADRADAQPGRVVALTATEGLVNFREGNIAAGRTLYESAIELAKGNNLRRLAALALVFWAKEEQLAGTPDGANVIADVDRIALDYTDPAFQLVVRTLRTGRIERLRADDSRVRKADPTLV